MYASSFLDKVLGIPGATIMRHTASLEPVIDTVLVPRAAVSWIRSVSTYRGEIPGLPGSSIEFKKSETSYEGSISWPQGSAVYRDSSLEFVAATVVVALGLDPGPVDAEARHLARLGKTIDLLVKSQNLGKPVHSKLAEPLAPKPPETDPTPNKLILPSQKKMMRPRIPGVRIKKSQSPMVCLGCSQPQFEGDAFVGCACIKDLAKSTEIIAINDDIYIRFGPLWDQSGVLILEETYVAPRRK